MAERYREIILHAGPGKTGTTSIQTNCYRYRDLLAAHGIVYPGFQLKERCLINHSDAITTAVCDPPTKYGAGWRQGTEETPGRAKFQIRSQWQPLLRQPQGEVLILSGESVAEYSDADLQVLRAELEPHCDRLRVFAFIRSPQSSLESILQQRVKGGAAVEARSILGVVKKRYVNLKRNFPDELEAFNFHEAVQHPLGLVGFFLEQCGLAPADLPEDIAASSSNERISLEAFDILFALNSRYPRRRMQEHGVIRRAQDLRPLKFLPGQPFQLRGLEGARLQRSLRSETRWLERELGCRFPEPAKRAHPRLWQDETLNALEDTINRIKEPALRAAAVEHLELQSRKLRWRDMQTAALLEKVAGLLTLSLTEEGLKARRREKQIDREPLTAHRAEIFQAYKEQLVQQYPLIRLAVKLKGALHL